MRSLCLLGALVGAGCDIFGGGPVPNPFPPIPDAGVVVRVRNEIGLIVDATIVYTDDGVEVRRTNLIIDPSAAGQYVEIEKTVVDRIIALAVVSNKNTTLPSNLKVGDPLFAKVFQQGADFSEGDTLTIVIKSETPVTQPLPDCNANQVPDFFEILLNPAADCDNNGSLDACEIAANPALDCNGDGKLNACETEAPVITQCPADRDVNLGAECLAVVPDLRPEVQASDNCTAAAALTISQSPAAGSPITSAGPVSVTIAVDDNDGHVTNCSVTITAVDVEPPVIQSCESLVSLQADESCSAALPDLVGALLATDNCTAVNALVREQSPPAGTPIAAGSAIQVTLTVRDQAGLSAQCVVSVKALDQNAPIITCPADLTVECDTPLTPGLESAVGIAMVVDDCDPSPQLTYSDVVVPYDPKDPPYDNDQGGKSDPYGCGVLLRRTWVATDASGNSSSCVQEILVTDTTAPSITCPPNVQIECGESEFPDNPYVGAATVSDICDAEPFVDYSDSVGEPDCEVGKVIWRTWYAIDNCGNYNDCTQIITIVDTQPPVLTVPDDITVQCDESIDPGYIGYATAEDACSSEPSVYWEDEYPSGSGPSCDGYTVIRHWTASDDCGNDVTIDQMIHIVDSQGPEIVQCPSNLTLPVEGDCTAQLPDLTEGLIAYDNCSEGYNVQQSPAPGSILSPGVHIVTFFVSDDCENVSECTAEVTVTPQVAGGVLYVDSNAEGNNDGSSWNDAFTDLSRALTRAACANSPVEIWIARGTYRPDGGTGERSRSFVLSNHVALFGGFYGGETEKGQRDPDYNPVILSGELGQPGISDNTLHVVVANQVNVGSVLDGVTITRGNANIASTSADSGGLRLNGSSPLIRNCKFIDNRALLTGGALECRFDSDPIFENCTFSGNSSATGGAVRAWGDARPIFRNCIFTANSATLGGAVEHNADSWPTYINCVFAGNTADGGGAVANTGSVAEFINCTIYGNTAGGSRGGGMRSNGGNTTLVNCILWGNTDSGSNLTEAQAIDFGAATVITYSCIQDAVPGDGFIPFGGAASHNIDLDPRLSFPSLGDFTLMWNSPCIDAGSNSAVPAGIAVDLAGNPRIIDGDSSEFATVDMGALEFQGE